MHSDYSFTWRLPHSYHTTAYLIKCNILFFLAHSLSQTPQYDNSVSCPLSVWESLFLSCSFYALYSLGFSEKATTCKYSYSFCSIFHWMSYFLCDSETWFYSSITLRFGSKTVFCCSCMHLFSSVAFWNLSTPSYDSSSFAGVWIQNDNTKNMRSSCDAWIQGPVFRVNKGVPILQHRLKLAAFSISFPVLCHSVFATLLLRYLDHSQNQVHQNWFKCSYGDRKTVAHFRFYSTPRVCLHPTQIHLVT